jgi:hypothetical protein
VHVWGRNVEIEPERMIKGAKVVVSVTEEERTVFAGPLTRDILTGDTGVVHADGGGMEHVQIIVEESRKMIENVNGWFCVVSCEVIVWK